MAGIVEWNYRNIDREKIIDLAVKCNIPFVSAAIMYARGFTSKENILNFLNDKYEPKSENLFEIPDMDKAVSRLKKAIKNREKICVYGDYDADGVTATALMFSYLKEKSADVFYYIPKREKDGYGLKVQVIDFLKSKGVELILTVDNGISAFDEISYANSIGMDVVVTDHHRVPENLPPAVAVIDMFREDCDVKDKNFAGVGIAFKLIEAMENGNLAPDKYIDLVTLGTIGDSIELFGETRSIVKRGIKAIKSSNKPGIKSLIGISNLEDKRIDAIGVAFCLVPRINASGRMGDASLALKLLVSGTENEAERLASELNELNIKRRETENDILNSVEELLRSEPQRKYQKIIIAEGDGWHRGVLGIVASRIAQKYSKPTILISRHEEDATASCRSIQGFSIHNLISMCSDLVERFGGHPMAAGINLKSENIEKFKGKILKTVADMEVPYPKLEVDLSVNPSKITNKILNDINFLKPFGVGNPEPVFALNGMKLKKIIPLSKGAHTKIIVERENAQTEVLCFNQKTDEFLYSPNEIVDLAVTFSKNEYKKFVSLSTMLLNMKLSGLEFKEVIEYKKIYEKFKRGEKLSKKEIKNLTPVRDDFVKVYKYFLNQGNIITRADILSYRIFGKASFFGKICIITDVLHEQNLINLIKNADELRITVNQNKTKVDLNESEIMMLLKGEI
ncbi:MAG: single-stranded-DNA-specific exonuclease RecJ [Acutalibacteraceae bacterium]